jgi:rhamnosyltransferase
MTNPTTVTSVTLLIPTWNAGPEFPDILRLMKGQRLRQRLEILVIDSGSTDGTAEFLRDLDVRLIEIPNAEFNHGLTRQRGIQEATGDVVVLTAQDARPADNQWMQRLVDCFADPQVAGAYSRQAPRPDANPFIRDRLSRWVAAADRPREQSVGSEAAFDALAPLEKLGRVAFDNVSSAVRRKVALEIPFRERRFGEDLDWGHRVLLAGYKIIFEPRSCVIHSHNKSIWYETKRVYLDHQNVHRLFGVHTIPRWGDVIRRTVGGVYHLTWVVSRDPTLTPWTRLAWWSKVVPYVFTQNLAQFLGARSAAPERQNSPVYRWVTRRLASKV